MNIKLSSTLACTAALAFAAGAGDAGRAAVDAAPPGAAACTALAAAQFATVTALSTAYEAGSADAAGPLRRARLRRAAHRRRRQAVRDPLRAAAADDVERTIPVPGRRRQRRHGGAGGRPQHGIVPGHRPPARLRRRHHGCRPSGRDAEFGLDPVARVDHAYAAHERTYTIAMAILSRYYGRAPDREVLRRLLRRRTAGHDVRRSATPRTSTASPSARRR